MTSKRALITGITGQDGSYLAEYLLEKGYRVSGIIRRSSDFNTARIDHIFDRLQLFYGDMTDHYSLRRAVEESEPDEVYNLAAQSHVKVSFDMPNYTFETNATGVNSLLDIITDMDSGIKFYQASTSELFGGDYSEAQNENTPFNPKSPYAIAKQAAFYLVQNYRDQGLFATNGVLFNHESERRGDTFVTKKIVKSVARIAAGLQENLHLGNITTKRDWGYAKDYVKAMHLMLQYETPEDFVIATGESHSVTEFLQKAFSLVGLNWQEYVIIDPKYFRPVEVKSLLGDPTKAKNLLGWKPETSFDQLIEIMVRAEMEKL